jgi:signal transduction histidine kinase
MQSEAPADVVRAEREPTIDELKHELADAQRREAATATILRVISQSPADVGLVLKKLAESAALLCQAEHVSIWRFDGRHQHVVVTHNVSAERRAFLESNPIAPGRSSAIGRVTMERRTIHIDDARADAELTYGSYGLPTDPTRTVLAVPMLRSDELLGVIFIHRTEVQPFAASQISLMETFADQAVIATENTRLFEEVQARTTELTEALEHQTATSEVLGVISRSPTELQPVLEGIVKMAGRLCQADHAHVFRLRDGKYHLAAHNQTDPKIAEYLTNNPMGLEQLGSVTARAARLCKTVHVANATQDPEYGHGPLTFSNDRTVLSVPLLRDGEALGVLTVGRQVARPFTRKEIELIETFADQAVIAIENTRLFEAEQASKRELQESLEYQTATSEVLNVISRSPTELQPVLDAIAATAARLCESMDALVWRVADGKVRVVAQFGSPNSALPLPPADFPGFPMTRGSVTGRAIMDQKTIHVHDLAAMVDSEYPDVKELQQRVGHRTTLATPLLSQGEALGAILVRKNHVHPFSDRQIALLQTFADQAVIAIENARLFEEVQARTRELQEALEQQTATSEILRVISRSVTDIQPVLDTISANALRLCVANFSAVLLFDGEVITLASPHNLSDPSAMNAFRKAFPRRPRAGGATDQAILTKSSVHIPDVRAHPDYPHGALANATGYRSILSVPMLREGHAVGAITVAASAPGAFSEQQIELLQTFADQAVIAIENTRLFEAEQVRTKELQARSTELAQSLEYQTAISNVLGIISRSKFDLQPVLDVVAENAARVCGANDARLLRPSGDFLRAVANYGEISTGSTALRLGTALTRGSVSGRAFLERRTIHVEDLAAELETEYPDAKVHQQETHHRTTLATPLLGAGAPLGVILIRRKIVKPFAPEEIQLLETFADQAVIAIENARLFEEVQARTRELAKTVEDLEIASQHKSQFVANMSHELRTPLAAILGYAELMQEGFYEPQGPKTLDALTRIRSNGKHLLGLINTVLDIAKIESGQFSLNLGEYAIESVVETVRAATESLAETKKLALKTEVAKSLPIGFGDEQRLTQVLLNLVGNAIKFTDTGEVRITAKADNGQFAVSVADTGPGIPTDQLTRVFEQFHQVDSSNTKAKGGTGLGLAIAKQIVEMHGGRVWVESEPGQGATFLMQLPVRAERRKTLQ